MLECCGFEPQRHHCVAILRGWCFLKLLFVCNLSWINKNWYFIKETDTFSYIHIWTIYTVHTDHFTSQHTAFEHSAACFSVILVTTWFYFVCNIVTRWANYWEKHLHNYELQLSDYNMGKYFRPNVQISGIIFFSPIFAYKFFKVKSKNCK